VLLQKSGELLSKDYDWSDEVAAIRAPTLLMYADADAIRPAHAIEFVALLGGGRRDSELAASGMFAARLPFFRKRPVKTAFKERPERGML
jgi:pimeloyl-ACP methyl ester carboxylesterase